MVRQASKESATALQLTGLQGLAVVGIGVFLIISVLVGLAYHSQQPWIMAPFGGTCMLLLAYRQGPFSRARNVIGGHFLSSLIGLSCLHLFGFHWWAVALACALATMAMIAARVVHPPAGSNPILIFLANSGWQFLLTPTLVGAVSLVLIAKAYWYVVLRRYHA